MTSEEMCAYVYVCVLVCVHKCVYVCLYVCVRACMAAYMCALPYLWLKPKYQLSWAPIPGAVGVACGAIPDDNTDANHRYEGHICI